MDSDLTRSSLRSSVVIALLSAGLLVCCASASRAYAQEACYRDDAGRVVKRRRPGYVEVPCPTQKDQANRNPTTQSDQVLSTPIRSGSVERGPPPSVSPVPRPGIADYVDSMPVPDRWRIVDALGYSQNIFDPYNRNVLKADKPVHGDWFFDLKLFSDTSFVKRNLVSSVGSSSSAAASELDIFGHTSQSVFSQTVGAEFIYYKGDTVFKPPDWEFRFTPVFNFNRASVSELEGINANPNAGETRTDHHIGIQAAFVDKHLHNVSDRFDFDSFRLGIQPFSTDFRGFLFQDNQLGARLFGTRENNLYQYNLAYFRRIEKDTNSGLNDLGQPLRHDDIFVANLYRQELPVSGFTSQATVVYNRNREGEGIHYDSNGFIVRPASIGIEVPRDYNVVYLGYNGDGHVDRYNLTTSVYYAVGHETPGTFVRGKVDISAWFAALELSRDFDWVRARLSFLYGSGDRDPFDRKATGFDAILENPQFAGGETSYWISQAVPLVGGGGVALSGGNGVLNSLRSSKDEGQSNFTNPGILLAGLGADFDILPQLRLSLNFNDLSFAETAVLDVARNQAGISKHIGEDLSASIIYRPLMTQNIVLRASYARLITGHGFDALFPNADPNYFLLNAIFVY